MTEQGKAPAARTAANCFRCPVCGLPANNVDGDPFANDPEAHFSLVVSIESHISCGCDNGHLWFEAARFNSDGEVIDRASGFAGTRCPWEDGPKAREQSEPLKAVEIPAIPDSKG